MAHHYASCAECRTCAEPHVRHGQGQAVQFGFASAIRDDELGVHEQQPRPPPPLADAQGEIFGGAGMKPMRLRIDVAFGRTGTFAVAAIRSGNKIVFAGRTTPTPSPRPPAPANDDDRGVPHARIIRPFGARSISGNFLQ